MVAPYSIASYPRCHSVDTAKKERAGHFPAHTGHGPLCHLRGRDSLCASGLAVLGVALQEAPLQDRPLTGRE